MPAMLKATNNTARPAPPRSAALFVLIVSSLALPGCSTVSGTVASVTGKEGVTTDKEARFIKPEDPMARPVQVAWTAARAKHCGFMFDPGTLRANYLADEARRGVDQNQMQKITKAYDYTYASLMETISADPGYCNKQRIAAIRVDLTRYLAGDYAPNARAAR
jgi:hypothetical protein